MTRSLPVTQRQAQALLRAAEAEKAIVEVKVGEATFRLIPASLAQASDQIDNPDALDSLDEYLGWRDRNRAREDQGHS